MMPTRIEVNFLTGERREIELTPEEIADAEARAAAEVSAPAPDPVEKLRVFLAANPDVAALLDHG